MISGISKKVVGIGDLHYKKDSYDSSGAWRDFII